MLEIEPKHERAKNNLYHYGEALKAEKDTENQSDEPVKINNKRHESAYEERDKYEALCRGDGSEVFFSKIK